MAEAVQAVLAYFILPIWFLAGIADWLCHRATDIEHTTGAKESIIHLLMFGEIAVPLVACLFLDINALVFLIMIGGFLAHEATALWDVSYAVKRRWISPFEQHVHSFLELIPLMAGLFIGLLHWEQLLALFGLGTEAPRFTLAWKDPPLPAASIAAVLGGAIVLELLPYCEEFWRGLRGGHGNLVPPQRS